MAAAALQWKMTAWVDIDSPYGNADHQAAFREAIALTDDWEVDTFLDSGDAAVGNITAIKQSGGSPRQPDMRIFLAGFRSGTTAPAERGLYTLTADVATVDTDGYNWVTCSPDCGSGYTLATWKTDLLSAGVQTGFRNVAARTQPSYGGARTKLCIFYNEEFLIVVYQGTTQAFLTAWCAGPYIECLDSGLKWTGDLLYAVGGTLNVQLGHYLLAGGVSGSNPWFGANSSSYCSAGFIDKNGVQGGVAMHPYAGYGSTDHYVGVDSWLVEGGIRLDEIPLKDTSRSDLRRIGSLRQIHPWGGALCRSILLDEDGVTRRGLFFSGREDIVSTSVLLYNPA